MKILRRLLTRLKLLFKRLTRSQDSDSDNFKSRLDSAEEQITFMSSIIAEQSRLLASLAYVQNDLAQSISALSGSSGGDLYIKIPQANDDFMN